MFNRYFKAFRIIIIWYLYSKYFNIFNYINCVFFKIFLFWIK